MCCWNLDLYAVKKKRMLEQVCHVYCVHKIIQRKKRNMFCAKPVCCCKGRGKKVFTGESPIFFLRPKAGVQYYNKRGYTTLLKSKLVVSSLEGGNMFYVQGDVVTLHTYSFSVIKQTYSLGGIELTATRQNTANT